MGTSWHTQLVFVVCPYTQRPATVQGHTEQECKRFNSGTRSGEVASTEENLRAEYQLKQAVLCMGQAEASQACLVPCYDTRLLLPWSRSRGCTSASFAIFVFVEGYYHPSEVWVAALQRGLWALI